MISSIVCDVDGTLVDNFNATLQAFKAAAAWYGKSQMFNLPGFYNGFGERWKEFAPMVFPHASETEREEFHKAKKHRYKSELENKIEPVCSLVKTAWHLGVMITIASASSRVTKEYVGQLLWGAPTTPNGVVVYGSQHKRERHWILSISNEDPEMSLVQTLVIDDDPEVLHNVKQFGCKTMKPSTIVSNLEEAIQCFKQW